MNVRLLVASGTAVAIAVAASSLAGAGPSPRLSGEDPSVGAMPTTSASFDGALMKHFQVLRSSGNSADGSLQATLRGSFPRQSAANPGGARVVHIDAIDRSVAIVPSATGVCLWISMAHGESGSTCTDSARAVAGQLSIQVGDPRTKKSTVVALVPDGGSAIAIDGKGARTVVDVRSNLAAFSGADLRTLAIGDATQDVTLPKDGG